MMLKFIKEKGGTRIIRATPPTFLSNQQAQDFFAQEKIYWRDGVHGLTGIHYFHLTQTKMKDIEAGEFYPKFRSSDKGIFEQIEYDRKHNRFTLWLSRREYGKSSIMATIFLYMAVMYPGCQIVVTSADKARIQQFFTEKFTVALSGMHPMVRPTVNRVSTAQEVRIELNFTVKDEYGEPVIKTSTLFGRETNETPKSPQKISGGRTMCIGIDEIALHNRVNQLLGSATPALQKSGANVGYMILTGTVEKEASEASLAALRSLTKKEELEARHMSVYFTPFHHGMHSNEYGVDDTERSIKWRAEEMARLTVLSDKTALAHFEKNYPATIEEALSIGLIGALPPEIMAALNYRSKELLSVSEHKYVLHYEGEKVVAERNNDGDTAIMEHPIPNEDYIAGIDPIPLNVKELLSKSEEEKRSKFCIVIKRRSTNQHVAYLMIRIADTTLLVKKAIMLQEYFNNAVAMIENNRGDGIIEIYKTTFKKPHLLADEPKMFRAKGQKKVRKGYPKGGDNSKIDAALHERFIQFLIKHTENIIIPTLVDQAAQYLTDANLDLVDAVQACELYDYDLVRLERKTYEKPKYRDVHYIANENGKNVWKIAKEAIEPVEIN